MSRPASGSDRGGSGTPGRSSSWTMRPTARTFVTGADGGAIVFWDAATGAPLNRVFPGRPSDGRMTPTFLPDGHTVLIAVVRAGPCTRWTPGPSTGSTSPAGSPVATSRKPSGATPSATAPTARRAQRTPVPMNRFRRNPPARGQLTERSRPQRVAAAVDGDDGRPLRAEAPATAGHGDLDDVRVGPPVHGRRRSCDNVRTGARGRLRGCGHQAWGEARLRRLDRTGVASIGRTCV